MELKEFFPFWDALTPAWQAGLREAALPRRVGKGERVHNGSEDCVGLLLLQSGRLRVFIVTEEDREITLYRLFERDICLFSASCMMPSIQFDVMVEAEEPATFWQLPAKLYQKLMKECAPAALFTNELMATRFSDVMWVLDQILSKKLDARLAALLLEEAALQGEPRLSVTHEELARHLGSAREVITRMLKYFSAEGLVKLTRGGVALLDEGGLTDLAGDSLR